jgi:crossover junction endodeoxyribonuclease RusA
MNTPPHIADMEAEEALLAIVLPWPDKRLSPNARVHWAAKSALTKKARADAAVTVLEAAGARLSAIRAGLAGEHPIHLRLRFHEPDRRGRDADNIMASLKGAIDGIADALQVNDRRFATSYSFGVPGKPGRVEVTL